MAPELALVKLSQAACIKISMIYTLGHTKSYEQYFREQNTPRKLGRTKDYCGGSVWKTKKEAEGHCPKDYSVYGVKATWNKDSTPTTDGSWHDLLVTSDLVKLIN